MSEIVSRIKELRLALQLNQDEFAEKLNLKRNSITLIETGRRNPSERTIMDICREFDVNDDWLRTGKGDMFIQLPPEDEYFKAATELSKNNDKLAMQAVIDYWKLDDDSKELLKNFIVHIAEKSKE